MTTFLANEQTNFHTMKHPLNLSSGIILWNLAWWSYMGITYGIAVLSPRSPARDAHPPPPTLSKGSRLRPCRAAPGLPAAEPCRGNAAAADLERVRTAPRTGCAQRRAMEVGAPGDAVETRTPRGREPPAPGPRAGRTGRDSSTSIAGVDSEIHSGPCRGPSFDRYRIGPGPSRRHPPPSSWPGPAAKHLPSTDHNTARRRGRPLPGRGQPRSPRAAECPSTTPPAPLKPRPGRAETYPPAAAGHPGRPRPGRPEGLCLLLILAGNGGWRPRGDDGRHTRRPERQPPGRRRQAARPGRHRPPSRRPPPPSGRGQASGRPLLSPSGGGARTGLKTRVHPN